MGHIGGFPRGWQQQPSGVRPFIGYTIAAHGGASSDSTPTPFGDLNDLVQMTNPQHFASVPSPRRTVRRRHNAFTMPDAGDEHMQADGDQQDVVNNLDNMAAMTSAGPASIINEESTHQENPSSGNLEAMPNAVMDPLPDDSCPSSENEIDGGSISSSTHVVASNAAALSNVAANTPVSSTGLEEGVDEISPGNDAVGSAHDQH